MLKRVLELDTERIKDGRPRDRTPIETSKIMFLGAYYLDLCSALVVLFLLPAPGSPHIRKMGCGRVKTYPKALCNRIMRQFPFSFGRNE